jgi:vacuolar protein sorting-associated protein VTA1
MCPPACISRLFRAILYIDIAATLLTFARETYYRQGTKNIFEKLPSFKSLAPRSLAMASNDLPVSVKQVRPYLMRANELQTAYPLVSYYCKLYALQKAVDTRDTTDPAAVAFVRDLLKKVEAESKIITGTRAEHRSQIEACALDLFDGAAAKYRAGTANGGTAMRFFAAKCVIDVSAFVDGEPLTEFMGSYRVRAVTYAANIRTDLREKRTPAPPQDLFDNVAPVTAEEEAEMDKLDAPKDTLSQQPEQKSSPEAPEPDVALTNVSPGEDFSGRSGAVAQIPGFTNHFPANAPAYPESGEPSPLSYQRQGFFAPSSALPKPVCEPVSVCEPEPDSAEGITAKLATGYPPRPERPAPVPESPPTVPGSHVVTTDFQAIVEAQKRTKNALSALDFQDVTTAVTELRAALTLLLYKP